MGLAADPPGPRPGSAPQGSAVALAAHADGPGTAIVGTGAAARAHADALRMLGLPAPKWVVGRSRPQAAAFARATEIAEATDDLQVALRDPAVSIVVIATPSQLHAEQAQQALAAGKHVLAEIPVALSAAGAEAVMAAATLARRRVFVCHVLRSQPAMREVKRRFGPGGTTVSQIAGSFLVPRRNNEGRTGIRSWIDNLLWHHACHQMDAALWVLDLPAVSVVAAVEGRRHVRYGMAMDLGLVARTETGQVITQTLSYNTSVLHWELRFMGDRESLLYRDGALFDDAGSQIVPPAALLDLRGVWADVVSGLAGGTATDFDLRSILPVMHLLQAADEAMESNR